LRENRRSASLAQSRQGAKAIQALRYFPPSLIA
jgi:hypothetical protein